MDVNLVLFSRDGRRRDIDVPDGVFVIGRATDCNVRIPVSEVSRKHAELKVSKGIVVIKDLDSSNGTYVNVERTEERELEPGDKISIGPVVFTVQIDGEPETIEPVRTALVEPADVHTTDDAADSGEFGAELEEDVNDDSDLLDALAGDDGADDTHIPADDDA